MPTPETDPAPKQTNARAATATLWQWLRCPYVRTPLLVLAILLIAWIATHYHRILPTPDLSQYNTRRNAIWLSRHWMREPLEGFDETDLRARLDRFRDAGIRYLFPHCCPMDEAGHLPSVNAEQTQRFVRMAAEYGDAFRIMPWIGGSIATVDLSNTQQRDTWVAEVAALVSRYDFPGVNVNIEPLSHNDQRLYAWLAALREALGKDRTISFCGIRPENKHGDRLGVWTASDYEQLAGAVDLIAVMSYDTGRKLPLLYVRWTATQFPRIAEAIQRGGQGRCTMLWGIPVYEDHAAYFRPDVENIRTTFQGLGKGLAKTTEPSPFEGIALYAEWTMDEREWDVYDHGWNAKQHQP